MCTQVQSQCKCISCGSDNLHEPATKKLDEQPQEPRAHGSRVYTRTKFKFKFGDLEKEDRKEKRKAKSRLGFCGFCLSVFCVYCFPIPICLSTRTCPGFAGPTRLSFAADNLLNFFFHFPPTEAIIPIFFHFLLANSFCLW